MLNKNSVVLTELKQNIFTITLNRPELHNAFNAEVIAELTKQLQMAATNAEIKVIVLAANGKSFCAGADLNWMQQTINYSFEENLADATQLATLMHTLFNLTKPTIAKIQGAAFGGGIGLIACCDIAVASNNVNFCFAETKIGMVPAVISPYIIRAIGERATQRYFLTAETFNAEEAKQLGLIQLVTTINELDNTTDKITAAILKNSQQALSETKKLLRQLNTAIINDKVIQDTINCIAKIRVSAEGQEGLKAFLEKRAPGWMK